LDNKQKRFGSIDIFNEKEATSIYLASSTFIKRGGGTNAFFFGASLPS
jgi:hypothetical protein